MSDRIRFKLCTLVYRCLQGLAPHYLSDLYTPVTVHTHLRSSVILERLLPIPRTKTKTIGPRGFFFASSAAWNTLPVHLLDPELSLNSFKIKLKTHFFLDVPHLGYTYHVIFFAILFKTCLFFNFCLPKSTISSLKSSCSKIHLIILCCLSLIKLAHNCKERTTNSMNAFAANLKGGGRGLTHNFPWVTFQEPDSPNVDPTSKCSKKSDRIQHDQNNHHIHKCKIMCATVV